MIHADYYVTTREMRLFPLTDDYSANELTAFRALRGAADNGGFATGGARALALQRVLSAVLGVLAGDVAGGDIDTGINEQTR